MLWLSSRFWNSTSVKKVVMTVTSFPLNRVENKPCIPAPNRLAAGIGLSGSRIPFENQPEKRRNSPTRQTKIDNPRSMFIIVSTPAVRVLFATLFSYFTEAASIYVLKNRSLNQTGCFHGYFILRKRTEWTLQVELIKVNCLGFSSLSRTFFRDLYAGRFFRKTHL